MTRGAFVHTIAAIDIAVWDSVARRQQVPLQPVRQTVGGQKMGSRLTVKISWSQEVKRYDVIASQ